MNLAEGDESKCKTLYGFAKNVCPQDWVCLFYFVYLRFCICIVVGGGETAQVRASVLLTPLTRT